VVAMDDSGAEVIRVTTGGKAPDVSKRQMVQVSGLIAVPWAIDGRSGVAFRADSVIVAKAAGARTGAAA
jgi:hypothetical protein